MGRTESMPSASGVVAPAPRLTPDRMSSMRPIDGTAMSCRAVSTGAMLPGKEDLLPQAGATAAPTWGWNTRLRPRPPSGSRSSCCPASRASTAAASMRISPAALLALPSSRAKGCVPPAWSTSTGTLSPCMMRRPCSSSAARKDLPSSLAFHAARTRPPMSCGSMPVRSVWARSRGVRAARGLWHSRSLLSSMHRATSWRPSCIRNWCTILLKAPDTIGAPVSCSMMRLSFSRRAKSCRIGFVVPSSRTRL